jgi:hypothetical protein
MPYKRPVQNAKKFLSPFYVPNPFYPINAAGSSHHKEKDFFGIPLPNEREANPEFAGERKSPS